MKKSIFLLACLIGMASCSKKEDLFDKTHVQEESKENFPTQDIDPDHDWNMAAVGTLKVSINQKTGEVYTVKVYTGNPLNEQSGAKLIASKEGVKDGETVSLSFDLPKAITYVYVLLEDKIFNRSVKMVNMTSSLPAISWGVQNRTGRNMILSSRGTITYTSPSNTDFFKDMPGGSLPYPKKQTDVKGGTNYYLENTSSPIHGGTDSYNLYIKGKVSLGAGGWPSGVKVYVLEGSTLNMEKGLNLSENTTLYIAKGATLIASKIQGTGTIYNRGVVNVNTGAESNVDLNNGGYIYNEGTFTVSGRKTKVTDDALFVNLGSLNVLEIWLSAQGKLLNESGATFTVNDLATLRDKETIFENSGSFKSADLQATNGIIYNRCRMEVGTSDFNGTTFEQDGNGYFVTNTFVMSNSKVNLGSEALFYVKSNLTYNGSSTITGIGGDSAKKSLFLVEAVCKCGWQAITYNGTLKVAVKGHNPENTKWGTYYIVKDDAEIIGLEQVELGTTPNECGNSYTTDNGGEEGKNDNVQIYTYAFEDITTEAGDYDFNDVVLKVKTVPVDGKLEVTLVAAGATKNLKVYYGDDHPLFQDKEVHEAMECKSGEMINTGGVRGTEVTDKTIDWPKDYTLQKNGNFYILDVKTKMKVKLPAFDDGFASGMVPYAILVPDDWDYPSEGQRVDKKYPDFVEWAKKADSNINWYNPTR